jgi:hypothetical protein
MGKLPGKMIRDSAIDTNHLANDAVTSQKIGPDAIDSPSFIGDNVVQEEHIVDDAILARHISQEARDEVLDSKYFVGYTQIDGATAPSGTNSANFGELLHQNFQSGDLSGSVSKAGVYLIAPNNRYEIRDNDTRDNIESPSGYQVYARGTTSTLSLTGTTAWTVASSVLNGTTTQFLTEVAIDDLLIAPNGDIMRVLSIASDTQLSLTDVYSGTTTSGETTQRDRVIISFYTFESGSEQSFNMSGETIDISMTESFEFGNMPHTAFTSGSTFAGGLPNVHTHGLDDITDVTATAAEVNQVCDGVTGNVNATNLNTLNAGSASDASSLHNHNTQYRTKVELSSTTGTPGGSLVGIDNSGLTHVTGSDVQSAIGNLDSQIGSAGFIVKPLTSEAVTAGNSFVQTLDTAPGDATKAALFVNGIKMRTGSGHDVTFTGTTINWLATADFDIELTDEVEARYFV